MLINIQDIEVKQLLLTAKKFEKENEKSLADVLLDIIYNSDDVRAVLEGIRLFYSITMTSDLTIEDIEKELELGQVIPFKRECESEDSDNS
jgi:hypothetical protein